MLNTSLNPAGVLKLLIIAMARSTKCYLGHVFTGCRGEDLGRHFWNYFDQFVLSSDLRVPRDVFPHMFNTAAH